MAEIHVEKKSPLGPWVWAILLIVVLAAAGYYLWHAGYLHASMAAADHIKLALMMMAVPHGA